MAMKMMLMLGASMVVLVAESQAQYWRPQNGYQQQRYPQQGYNQQYGNQQGYPQQQQQQQGHLPFQLPAGIPVTEAEWVCKNQKGDMMIITSEDGPTVANPGQQGSWQQQQQTYPQQRPPINTQPSYPQTQPSFPQTQPPMNPQGTYPNRPTTQTPSYPNYPTQPQPGQGKPNTNGDGLIDIRFGSDKK